MYDHVLVGTDGSDTAARAVEAAAHLARTHHARLTIAHAFRPPRGMPEPVPESVSRELPWVGSSGAAAEELVHDAARRAREATGEGLHVDTRIEPGAPVPVLLRLIDDLQPDAIVVGNADLTRPRLHRGIGTALARRGACDVVIVDTMGREPRRRGSRQS